jgi:3-hydroxymyristoyl/3-hydroxydecanoyl-(acyl carrier protein) dehydratase
VVEFATGDPSKAYGDRYRPFDRDRFLARLPAPPYSFLDRVVRVENCEPWKLAAGGIAETEYEVPPDAWYFAANCCDVMPYCVLNEIALQSCGWMAAYLGSAITSPEDLHFRNLMGHATQHADVGPDAGTLRTRVKLKSVSPTAGMIILQYDFAVHGRHGLVYSGDSTFGFFTKSALANQAGLKDRPTNPPNRDDEHFGAGPYPTDPPIPGSMLRMIDAIDGFYPLPASGRGLGGGVEAAEGELVIGRTRVDPAAWFFKAHFHQDPIWPGSLGLEALIQLMKVYAQRRWGNPSVGWRTAAPNQSHQWAYRGEILPTASDVTVHAYIKQVDDAQRFVKADGLLGVDGRMIYDMKGFTLRG